MAYNFKSYVIDEPTNDVLSDYIFVISGVFETKSRDELKKIIEKNGGKVSTSINLKNKFFIRRK